MKDALRIAVVGHSNVGKTSLLRTLARDAEFGEVADRPGTTRRVQGIALLVDGRPTIEFLDTPGLEDSISLLELLDSHHPDRRRDGPEQVGEFLASPDASGRFAPEAAALRAVLACHAAIYVIDARDRVLARHRDELAILARCGRPVVPVLNFVATPEESALSDRASAGAGARPGTGSGTGFGSGFSSGFGSASGLGHGQDQPPRTAEWRELLARVNLHAVVEFDAVVFDEAGEIRLFEKLQTLLDAFREPLRALIEERRSRARTLRRRASLLVADLLADAAQLVERVDRADSRSGAAAEARLRDRLRRYEQRCTDSLLAVFGFDRHDVIAGDLPLVEGRWGIDLFSKAALRRYGVGAGGGAAAGAATGVGVDLVLGGMTLGAAAALGAALGGVAGAFGLSGGRLVRKVRGGDELRASDRTLRLLGMRQMELVSALLRRGHAAVRPVRMTARAEGTSLDGPALDTTTFSRTGGAVAASEAPGREERSQSSASRRLPEEHGGGIDSAPRAPRAGMDRAGVEAALREAIALLRELLPETRADAALAGLAGGLAGGAASLGPRELAVRRAASRLEQAM